MRIAEYKQTGSHKEWHTVIVPEIVDEMGNVITEAHEEQHEVEVPDYSFVYRDATNDEMAEAQAAELERISAPAVLTDEDKMRLVLNSIPVVPPAEAAQGRSMDGGIVLPVKVGYRWEPRYDGSAIVYESVPDPNAIGTESNPIIYREGVPLIDNAFYMFGDVRKVYMGGEFEEF